MAATRGGRRRVGHPAGCITTLVSAVADVELFREVFGQFATGVAVVTAAGPGGVGGMTANALCSLSLEPPLALVCFENGARTLPIVREAGAFGLNVLSAAQEELAGMFASKLPESEKLSAVAHRLEHGVPVIEDVIAWACCRLRELIPGGDHTIAIGEVVGMGLGAGDPLLWFRGTYRRLPAPGAAPGAAASATAGAANDGLDTGP
jgi:3-hydroxy-9,10-secoandrosta-1,3,5(10)-triene-9,17-dione monooxygenase reductase component